jgi:hypothetical protein
MDETTLMKTLDKIWIKIQKDAGKNKWKKKKNIQLDNMLGKDCHCLL